MAPKQGPLRGHWSAAAIGQPASTAAGKDAVPPPPAGVAAAASLASPRVPEQHEQSVGWQRRRVLHGNQGWRTSAREGSEPEAQPTTRQTTPLVGFRCLGTAGRAGSTPAVAMRPRCAAPPAAPATRRSPPLDRSIAALALTDIVSRTQGTGGLVSTAANGKRSARHAARALPPPPPSLAAGGAGQHGSLDEVVMCWLRAGSSSAARTATGVGAHARGGRGWSSMHDAA